MATAAWAEARLALTGAAVAFLTALFLVPVGAQDIDPRVLEAAFGHYKPVRGDVPERPRTDAA